VSIAYGHLARMEELTHGSLFSGIGGFDLGFERAGFKTLWQVEKDARRCQWLAHNFPEAEQLGAIEDCGAHNLSIPTVVTGGFPCQPASTAGKRLGTADDRYLWPQMFRVLSALQPAWAVVENVLGLTSLDGGMVFESVLSDLESLGYDVQALEIPACAVGAPQQRFRVWIVAHLDDGRRTVRTDLSIQPHATEESRANAARHGAVGIAADVDRAGRANGQWMPPPPRASRRRPSALHIGRPAQTNHWETEPGVGELVHGVPDGLAGAVEAFGDAVVPQIAEAIGRMIRQVIEAR